MAKGTKTGGRRKGTPNRATADVRACVASIAQNLAPQVEVWITRGAKKNPLGAAHLMAQLLEYHIPKLSRAELSGISGKPIEVQIVRYSDPTSEQLAAAALPNGHVASTGTGLPPRPILLAPKVGQG